MESNRFEIINNELYHTDTDGNRRLIGIIGEDKNFEQPETPLPIIHYCDYSRKYWLIHNCKTYEFKPSEEYRKKILEFVHLHTNNWRKHHGLPMLRRGRKDGKTKI